MVPGYIEGHLGGDNWVADATIADHEEHGGRPTTGPACS